MADQTDVDNVDEAITKIANGGVSGFTINGEQANTLPIKDMIALRREYKDEANENANDGSGRGIYGADFRE